MKKLFYCLIPFLAVVAAAQAQSGVKTYNIDICKGQSVKLKDIYDLKDGYKITKIADERNESNNLLAGTDRPDTIRIRPTQETNYKIFYENLNDASDNGFEISTIGVKTIPELKVHIVNIDRIKDGMVCPGTELVFAVDEHGTDPVYWTVSGVSGSVKDESGFSYTPTGSCWITASASNGSSCPPRDTSFHVSILPAPESGDPKITVNTVFGATKGPKVICGGCGFFPEISEILTGVEAPDNLRLDLSTVQWTEGGTAEKMLEPGRVHTLGVKVHYVVARNQLCGSGTPVEKDTTLDLKVRVTGCEPAFKTSSSVKPCKNAMIDLENPFHPTVAFTEAPVLEVTPDANWTGVTGTAPAYIDQTASNHLQTYRWTVALSNYTGNEGRAEFKYKWKYTVGCPYSKTMPVLNTQGEKSNLKMKVDTNFVTAEYNYCPDAQGTLKLTLNENGKITAVQNATLSNSSVFTVGTEESDKVWIYNSVNPVPSGDAVSAYSPLEIKVQYQLDGCSYSGGSQNLTVHIKAKEDCGMGFDLASDSVCMGAGNKFVMKGGAGAAIDVKNIVVDRQVNEDLMITHGRFAASDNEGEYAFVPYYSGSTYIDYVKDTVTATAYYTMAGSSRVLQWTKQFPVKVKACRPTVARTAYVAGCPFCPGTQHQFSVTFPNPTTQTDKCGIIWKSVPYTEPLNIQSGSPVNQYPTPKWSQDKGIWTYVFRVNYLESTRVYMDVKYTAGDSVFTVVLDTTTRFNTASTCGVTVEPDRNGCCVGDSIAVDLINGNSIVYLGTLKGYGRFAELIWDESVLPYIYPQSIKPQDEVWASNTREGFRVSVKAYEKGVYPFTVKVAVKDRGYGSMYGGNWNGGYKTDTVYVRDTIRLDVIQKPQVFVSDTLYVCRNKEINLLDYVNWDIVKDNKIKINSTEYTRGGVYNKQYTVDDLLCNYSAELTHFCRNSSGTVTNVVNCDPAGDKKSMVEIMVDDAADIEFKRDVDWCPGEDYILGTTSKGRVSWYMQTARHEGGDEWSYGNRTLLAENLPNQGEWTITVGSDTVLYTAESRTNCPGANFQSVSFKMFPKAIPSLAIAGGGCGSTGIVLQALVNEDELADRRWILNNSTDTVSKTYAEKLWTGISTLDAVCIAYGKNGCVNRQEAQLVSFPKAQVTLNKPAGYNASSKTWCVHQGSISGITATGNDDYNYNWTSAKGLSLSGKDFYSKFTQDDTLYIRAGSGNICDFFDTVKVYLNPTVSTIDPFYGCLGEDLTLSVPAQAGVSYSWADPQGRPIPGADGKDLQINGFQHSQEGEYTVTLSKGGVCTVSEKVQLAMYEDPGLYIAGKTSYCIDESGVLKPGFSTGNTYTFTDGQWDYPGMGEGAAFWTESGEFRIDHATAAQAGTYNLALHINGCRYTATAEVEVNEHATPTFTLEKDVYCEGDDIDLHADFEALDIQYMWRLNNKTAGPAAQTDATISNIEAADEGPLYLYRIKGACIDSVSTVIRISTRPLIGLIATGERKKDDFAFFCEDDNTVLSVVNNQPGDEFTWFHPAETEADQNGSLWVLNRLKIKDAGFYAVQAERNGCKSEKILYALDVRLMPRLFLPIDTFICKGTELVVDVANAEYSGVDYYWPELNVRTSAAALQQGGVYTAQADLEGCVFEGEVRVSERALPEWDFPDDMVICERDSVVLTGPAGMDRYLWHDGSTGMTNVVRGNVTVVLEAEKDGCVNENSFTIATEFCSPLFFADVFTPNGDGLNDYFGPITAAEPEQLNYLLTVFTVTGEQVFKSANLKEGWDGKLKNGQPAPAGLYYYRCHAVVKQDGRQVGSEGSVKLAR